MRTSTHTTTQETNAPLVMQAKGLVKRYGQVTALDGADFELRAGEILAVIGDNGAGKSSLIKALSGATVPDEGEILLDGQPVRFRTPMDARRAGIDHIAYARHGERGFGDVGGQYHPSRLACGVENAVLFLR